ncbi:UDP-glucuronosyltransferase 2B2-like [Zophobas morio]|uniref:UDP-glucuronosyltransferase 2B2-like n=1 Tax=Zophobas morio TaxID=2755281 RepID=UPI0030839A30
MEFDSFTTNQTNKGPTAPPKHLVDSIEANQSLCFLNTNLLVYPPRPNVPVVVEIGQMHIKPVKPLPQDLQQILDDATEALSELPYKVLWKWESDYLLGRPKNVIRKKWFPQQDLLAHRNIRAFVTQGGLQSIEEAIFRGVPLIGMPFMRDQPMNVQKIIDMGIGLGIDSVTMSKEELKKCIIDVAENHKYHERIQEIRDILYDKPMTGLQKVVWWSEYVIRHKEAELLRSPAADFTWFDYLLLEVVLVAVVLSVNPLLYPLRPNVPAIVEMGQMHIKPVQPLPQDLQQILDDATEGVIYVSLGSNIKSVNLDEKLRNTIIEALSELPYKVLWKWESEYLPGRPKNVVTKEWFPQQDLLAHRNIRAFVTQGGLQSIEEAVSRGVPLIGMPFMGDQPSNVQKIVDTEIGLGVDPSTVSKDELRQCIVNVAENNKYKKRIEESRKLLYDKPMTGLEKVVWWVEYVIGHKGAKHLRSPTADFSYFDYFLVEVVLIAIVMISIIIYLSYKIIQWTKCV